MRRWWCLWWDALFGQMLVRDLRVPNVFESGVGRVGALWITCLGKILLNSLNGKGKNYSPPSFSLVLVACFGLDFDTSFSQLPVINTVLYPWDDDTIPLFNHSILYNNTRIGKSITYRYILYHSTSTTHTHQETRQHGWFGEFCFWFNQSDSVVGSEGKNYLNGRRGVTRCPLGIYLPGRLVLWTCG